MNKTTNFFAVDLGATSGRTILGTVSTDSLQLREITRFPNHIIETCGHFYWDIFALYYEIVEGLKKVAKENIKISSVGIDTWGVDFVFFGEDGEILRNPYSYRDPHTVGAMERYFSIVPREKVYALTGIQFMNFNSLFQLSTLHTNNCSALEAADKILFVPDALSYLLTGNMVTEYTIASTSQILNPATKRLEPELLKAAGVRPEQFAEMVYPGHQVGVLSDSIQKVTGLGAVPVIAVAGHDTASAVAAVPAVDEHFAYLSSGTWSLMGIETKQAIITGESFKQNFTNEGGIEGTTRFLKNICGLWLIERCRAEWEAQGHRKMSYDEMNNVALSAAPFRSLINPDAPCFANPASMLDAIAGYCKATSQPVPVTEAEVARCIFESLALRYRQVFRMLQSMSPFSIDCLHIIGGGSLNEVLDQFTSNAVGVDVLAGPAECTAVGNIMLQAKAAGLVPDIHAMRQLIARSVATKKFTPQDAAKWDEAYETYNKVYRTDI
jgi:rhamnulokinase